LITAADYIVTRI